MNNEAAVLAYFDDFVEAFATFDGVRVAAKFGLPFMAKGQADSCALFKSYEALRAHFQVFLDDYKSKGCRECRYSDLDLRWLGADSVLATVNWSLLGGSEAPILGWTESYLLSFIESRPLAFATIDHVNEGDTASSSEAEKQQAEQ
ncbi:hypothetical protein [Allohahella marinimesophila]|uniref:Uncharacterized protein n=1 Tax=Allohahella marinimesophila TaxID=1054972 RepID=A0ABP7PGM0_9GAMM